MAGKKIPENLLLVVVVADGMAGEEDEVESWRGQLGGRAVSDLEPGLGQKYGRAEIY